MAKKTTRKKLGKTSQPGTLHLEYNLHKLPSIQHKAGLAGMLIYLESREKRKLGVPAYSINGNLLTITLKADEMQDVFNDIYDATTVERSSSQKISNKTIIREESNNYGKRYYYKDWRPALEYLYAFIGDKKSGLIEMHRELLWSVIWSQPTTRKQYQRRHENKDAEIGKAYGFVKSLCIGAEDHNAEKIDFKGQSEISFLLNFFLLASPVFLPRVLDINFSTLKVSYKSAGYVICVPDIEIIADYKTDYITFIESISAKKVSFNKPVDALISVPEEGCLEYMSRITRDDLSIRDLSFNVRGFQVIHLERGGNKVYVHSDTYQAVTMGHIIQYRKLCAHYKNILYRTQIIRNILGDNIWFNGTVDLFARYPAELFVYVRDKTPHNLPYFSDDINKRIQAVQNDMKHYKGDPNMDDYLTDKIYQIIREYVFRKTEVKTNIKYDSFKDSKNDKGHTSYPSNFLDAKSDICRDAFLAMRGRQNQAFIEYFTGTICSIPQHLPPDDYKRIAEVLLTDWEKVKTLAMLALSAVSKTGNYKSASDETEQLKSKQNS